MSDIYLLQQTKTQRERKKRRNNLKKFGEIFVWDFLFNFSSNQPGQSAWQDCCFCTNSDCGFRFRFLLISSQLSRFRFRFCSTKKIPFFENVVCITTWTPTPKICEKKQFSHFWVFFKTSRCATYDEKRIACFLTFLFCKLFSDCFYFTFKLFEPHQPFIIF